MTTMTTHSISDLETANKVLIECVDSPGFKQISYAHHDHRCGDPGVHDLAHCPIAARGEYQPSAEGCRAMSIIERVNLLPDAAELRNTPRTLDQWEALLAEREKQL